MNLLEVKNLQKIYTGRFGGARVQALKNVSFTVEPGEYVAIMGESGSGKTTLLNLLAALDRPTGGSVILDGMDLATVKESAIAAFRRDNLGFVFQEFNLLDTFTVEDNIYLPLVLAGEKYDSMHARLVPLADKLGITSLLQKYPYEISGGQKQRLCIARALLTNPKVLILDDSTSAVDTATEARIREAFATSLAGTTKIIIAQRISSVRECDNIIVFGDGEIVGEGTHDELMSSCEDYRDIVRSQSGSAEKEARA